MLQFWRSMDKLYSQHWRRRRTQTFIHSSIVDNPEMGSSGEIASIWPSSTVFTMAQNNHQYRHDKLERKIMNAKFVANHFPWLTF